jgi:ribonuclease HII
MTLLGARFPVYGWGENAGYATISHRKALSTHGPTRHHRAAFGTVRILAELAE